MIANHKGEIPVAILLLPFLAGIMLGINFIPTGWLAALLIAFSTLLVTFVSLNLCYQRFKIYRVRWIGGLLINLLLLIAGCISVINYNELNNAGHFSKHTARHLLIRINNEPQLKNGLVRFTATVEECLDTKQATATNGTLLVTIKDSAAQYLQYGDELLVPANYNPVDPPFNPAEFNYKKYLAHQNVFYQSFIYTGQYEIIGHDAGNPIIASSLKLRRQMVARFKQQLHNPDAIAVASTLILGYKADLSEDVVQAYSKTGTIHVLSVSGAHVAIIYALLAFALSFLNRYKYGKVIKAVIIITLIWYYAMLTGFSPAVCRAAVMISMIIAGKTYSRYINSLNILAISAFALLLYNPMFIVDVGFQLSYLAVAGLIILQPVVYQWLAFKNKWADKLWALCSVSIAAQVITFPLSAFYFHQFPVYFLFSNLFIVIPTAVIMYSGLAYLLLSWVPMLSTALAWLLEKTILFMNYVLSAVEHAPFASISKIWLTVPEYLLLYAVIICLFYFLYDRKIWLLRISMLCLLLLSISISLKRFNADNASSITFLNLRKNMGIVFKNGDKAIVITNLQNTDKNYSYSIKPYLDSCKISSATIYDPAADIKSVDLAKHGNLIQFNNQRILILDKQLQHAILPQKIKTDYLYITGNPHIDVNDLSKNYDYKTLVIASSNLPRVVTNLESQAKIIHANYKVLKRNNSLIAVSN